MKELLRTGVSAFLHLQDRQPLRLPLPLRQTRYDRAANNLDSQNLEQHPYSDLSFHEPFCLRTPKP